MRAAPLQFWPPTGGRQAQAGSAGASLLFAGLSEEQFTCATSCLGIQAFSFEKDEQVLACQGARPHYGVLVSGTGFDVRQHPNGDQTLVDVIEPGDLFGEGWQPRAWAAPEVPRERAVIGATAGTVLLLDPARLSDPTVACPAKTIVHTNLLNSVLHKQERLRTKLEILRHRSLRGRIANYLLVESQRRGKSQFTIPLSRGELAQYLHADRAAVSRELARMKHDGMIDYHRNAFALRDEQAVATASE